MSELFYTWMEDAAAVREALATADDDEEKVRVAKAWVDVAKVALHEAIRAKRDLHRCSALAECPKGHRGRAKRIRVPCPKKSKHSGKRSKAMVPKG